MSTGTELQAEQLVAWLDARSPSQAVNTMETHISILAFQGERVYKLKKAVHFAFVDLSTPERRFVDCEREVALNRRFAPDVYLGVEPVTDADGDVVDHVVVMRRLSDARRLSALAAHDDDATVCIDRLAVLMARVHAEASTGGSVDAAATRDSVAGLWERELADFSRSRTDIAPLTGRYLAGRAPLFAARVASGRARDGHGDLLADDVFCLDDGPRVLDCLEFSDVLRFGDVLADVAFLAMDLETLGRPDLGGRFLAAYRTATHDDWPSSLEHFYIAYRAHVRAKVAALRGDEHGARSRLALARDHLERGRIRLVLVGGSPATGKTTVARAIAEATGWQVLRSDDIRKQLAGIAPTRHAAAALDEGIYTFEWTERTYETLCRRGRALLESGQSVVLDASWSDPRWRAIAEEVAAETASDLVALCCEAPVDVARARAAQRTADHEEVSDADAEIAGAVAARFAPWPRARPLDTTKPHADVVRAALGDVGRF